MAVKSTAGRILPPADTTVLNADNATVALRITLAETETLAVEVIELNAPNTLTPKVVDVTAEVRLAVALVKSYAAADTVTAEVKLTVALVKSYAAADTVTAEVKLAVALVKSYAVAASENDPNTISTPLASLLPADNTVLNAKSVAPAGLLVLADVDTVTAEVRLAVALVKSYEIDVCEKAEVKLAVPSITLLT